MPMSKESNWLVWLFLFPSDKTYGRFLVRSLIFQTFVYWSQIMFLYHIFKNVCPLCLCWAPRDGVLIILGAAWLLSESFPVSLELVCALLLQSYLILCNPMDCSPPGSSVRGILQARILECVATPSSRGPSRPGDGTHIPGLLHWQVGSLPLAPPGSAVTSLLYIWNVVDELRFRCSESREDAWSYD